MLENEGLIKEFDCMQKLKKSAWYCPYCDILNNIFKIMFKDVSGSQQCSQVDSFMNSKDILW